MNRAEEMKKEARAALFSTNIRSTAATGKPLFSTGSQSSFFKTFNIPTLKVNSCYKLYFNNEINPLHIELGLFLGENVR
jgi:hypothetical protein